MAQQSASPASRPDPEIIYYRGPVIVVTSWYVYTARRRYSVRELDRVWCAHEETHVAGKVALLCGGLELALAAPLAVAYGAVVLFAAGLVAAAGMGAAVVVESRRNPTWMALMARHRGEVVTLYDTGHQQTFNQVRRAVVRAVQANEDPARQVGGDFRAA